MIYLASPYSDPLPEVREYRFNVICEVTARLIREGHHVFSPIAHSHPLARHGLPGDWAFWEAYDRRMIAACDELWVCTMMGWRYSKGVQAEIVIAGEEGKPVRYIAP